MVITAPGRFFSTRADSKSVGRSYRLMLTATMLVIFIDGECAFALPFYEIHSSTGIAHRFYYQLVQGSRSEKGFSVENISGVSGKPLKINVVMAGASRDIPQNPEGPFFLMFEGLPAQITLSSGFRVKEGVWAVSFKNIQDLTLSAPAEFRGVFDVKAVLRRGAETDIQSHTFRVELIAPGAVITRSAPDPRQEAELIARAESLFRRGDLHAARSIYSDLAERGSNEAVFRLAQTYDPQVLKSLFIVGVQPDLERALELYRKASKLGVTRAQERLNLLSDSAR